ncbi:MAG: (Fe-S)-binding protein [Ignavibacteriaceae bacterium]
MIGAIKLALYRRYVLKVKRLEVDEHGKKDAAFILVLILLVVCAMFGQNIAHVAKQNFVLGEYEFRPVSYFLSSLFFTGWTQTADILYEVFWWTHITLILGFLNYLPYSKHLHIITSIPNVYLGKLPEEKNILRKINLEDETIEVYGAGDTNQLSRKQILDGFSCTECGRCTDACPAAGSGKSLSPRSIIVDVRKRTVERSKISIDGSLEEKTLVHNHVTDKELWQCTTCMACVEECPVMIEHIDSIVDMRRYLVLSESNFPQSLNPLFRNIETNFNPWAFNSSDREKWADGLGVKTMAESPGGDILFWVGCAGSFDARYMKVSQALVSIMQKAKIDFRILGNEEKCNGDTPRRLGNEYLAQQMMTENIEVLNKYNVKKIVTACPHCFNSLKNEYKQFGGNYEVIHHSQLISELIRDKKITADDNHKPERVTYHDSCYLGRYNKIYDAPRDIISSVPNTELLELERNRSKGFCCGAGGGQMFLEDEEGERINLNRTKEIIDKNPDKVATACPFCMTMISDGLKDLNKSDSIEIQDIAELINNNFH